MFRIIIAAVLSSAVTISAAQASPNFDVERHDCPAVMPAQIEDLFSRFSDAWATRDPDVVTDLFSDNPVLLATVSNRPRTDKAGVRDYFVAFLANSPQARIDTSTIEIDCRTASRVGTWTVSLTDPSTGVRTDVQARYSFLYRFEDGTWKIDHLHSSRMPEPQ